jgi:hypothetical protein
MSTSEWDNEDTLSSLPQAGQLPRSWLPLFFNGSLSKFAASSIDTAALMALKSTQGMAASFRGTTAPNRTMHMEPFGPPRLTNGTRRTAMAWKLRDLIGLSLFLLLLGAGMVANLSDSSMSQVRGAWVAQAMR